MTRTILLSAAAAITGAAALSAQAQQSQPDPGLVARARAIHERVITLDTHDDINAANFTADCNYTQRLTTQVNIPKMKEGGLDVAFFIVYVGQGPLTPEGYDNAYRQAVAKFDAVHRLTKEIAPDQIELALTPADVRRIVAAGKKVAVIGIENGYAIGTDIKRVEEFYNRGGLSLAHNGHSQLADSNTGEASGEWLHNGLSDLGKQVIAEMNRLGMMIDISHPSKQANLQTMALSKAPVIASHSSARAMGNHSRNLDDEELAALRKNGGVVQTVAFASYVNVTPPERAREIARLNAEFGLTQAGRGGGGRGAGRGAGRGEGPPPPRPCPVEGAAVAAGAGRGAPAAGAGRGGRGGQNAALEALPADRRAEYDRRLAAIDAKYPVPPRATVSDFVDHIDYLVKTIGIDHVGISSDFDGGGGVVGWSHAGESPNVTIELVRRGYTEEQIGQLWSGNLLRVWEQVEKAADRR
ncbi:MAG TPA: dipeptidase [Vicinamibacterales bacterium]